MHSQVHKSHSLALINGHADASGTGVGRAIQFHRSSVSGIALVHSCGRVGYIPVGRDVSSVIVGVCLLLVLCVVFNSVGVV